MAITAILALVALPAPATAQGEGMLRDDTGDVSIGGFACAVLICTGLPIGVPAPYPDYLDIVTAGIADVTETELLLELDLAGHADPPGDLLQAIPVGYISYGLQFTLNDEDATHGVGLYGYSSGPGERTWYAERYRYSYYGDDWDFQWEEMGAEDFSYSKEGSKVTFRLPIDFLKVTKAQRGVRAGDEVTWMRASSYESASALVLYVGANDYVSGEPGFVFERNVPNSVLSLGFLAPPEAADEEQTNGTGDGEEEEGASGPPLTRSPLALSAGRTKAVPLLVSNADGAKRLVNLTARVTGPDGAALAGWKAQAPPSVIVAGRSSLTVNVLVTAPPGAAHREGGILRVQGTVLGQSDLVGRAERDAYVAHGLTPEANSYYLHAVVAEGAQPFLEPAFGDAVMDKRLHLSTVRQDALYPEEPTLDATWGAYFGSADTVEPQELVMDPEGNVRLTLNVRSEDRERVLNFATIGGYETPSGRDIYLIELYDEEVSVGTSAQDLVWEFPIPKRGETIPEGSRFVFIYWLWEPPLGDFFVTPPGVKVDVTKSSVALPVKEVRSQQFRSTTGEFLPSLALTRGQSREDFANPGKAVAFNLTLVNGGTFEDVIDLEVNGTRAGWTTRLVPGSAFRLAPGASVNVGIEVVPPAGAKEGEVFDVGITATSRGDRYATSGVTVRVITTQGIQLEEKLFKASFDSQNATVPEKRDAPMVPSLASAMAFLLGFLAVARRRRIA